MNKYTSYITKRVLETDNTSTDEELDDMLIKTFLQLEKRALVQIDLMKTENKEPAVMHKSDIRLSYLIDELNETRNHFLKERHIVNNVEMHKNHFNIVRFFNYVLSDIGLMFNSYNLKQKGYVFSWIKHFCIYENKILVERVFELNSLEREFQESIELDTRPYFEPFVFQGINDTSKIEFKFETLGDFEVARRLLLIDARQVALTELIDKDSKIILPNANPHSVKDATKDLIYRYWNLNRFIDDHSLDAYEYEMSSNIPSKKVIKIVEKYALLWFRKLEARFLGFRFSA